jgi:hypothetical protein
MRGAGQGELDVGRRHGFERLASPFGGVRQRRDQGGFEEAEALERDARQERGLVVEVSVECRPGDADPGAHAAQRERAGALFPDGAHRGIHQGTLEVAVMVGAAGLATDRRAHGPLPAGHGGRRPPPPRPAA